VDLYVIACAIAGLFFAGIIKGATGIGYSSCALPFLVAALGLKTAIVLVVVPAMASNVLLLFSTGHVRDTFKRFWPLYAATLPGILCGIVLLSWADKHIPTQILGVLIVLYVMQAWAKPDFVLQPRIAQAAQVPVGLVNGLLTGFTGSQVLPLMPYMLSLKMPPDRLVQAVNIAVIIASAFLGFGLWATDVMSAPEFGFSLLAVIPALGGVQLGNWARQHIQAEQARSLVLGVLLLIAFSLIIRA
jgi:uncharacterized membrane protein YfcA